MSKHECTVWYDEGHRMYGVRCETEKRIVAQAATQREADRLAQAHSHWAQLRAERSSAK